MCFCVLFLTAPILTGLQFREDWQQIKWSASRGELFSPALDRDLRSFLAVLALCIFLQNQFRCVVQMRKQTINFFLRLENLAWNLWTEVIYDSELMYQHCCYAALTSVGSLSACKTHFSQNNAVALDSTIPCLIWEYLKKIDLHCHTIGVFLFNLFSWILQEIARR